MASMNHVQTMGILRRCIRLYKTSVNGVKIFEHKRSENNFVTCPNIETRALPLLAPNAKEFAVHMLSKQFMLTKKAPGVREEKEIFGVFPIIKELNAGNIPYEMYVTEKSLSEIRRIHQNYSTMLTETRINLLEENCFHSWFPQSVHSIVGIFRSAKAVEPRKKIPVTLIVDKVKHENVTKDLMRISKIYDCDNLYFTRSCLVPYESIEVKKQWEEIVALLPPNRTVIAIGTNQRIESKRYNPDITDEVLGSSNSCPIKRDDMELLVELPRNVNFTSIPHCVILVSGIKGLSSAARKLVYESCGIAVETPIIDSISPQRYDMEKALEMLKCVLERAQCDYQNRMRKSFDLHTYAPGYRNNKKL